MHRGDVAAVRQHLVSAQRLRPLLTYALPHLAVQARIELARVHLALADLAGARTLMREIDELLQRQARPRNPGRPGRLASDPTRERARHKRPGASAMTTAELRLLPLLSTHLSFPRSPGRNSSPNTIKSQAMSICRKLSVSSRSQAVARARELGLLDG